MRGSYFFLQGLALFAIISMLKCACLCANMFAPVIVELDMVYVHFNLFWQLSLRRVYSFCKLFICFLCVILLLLVVRNCRHGFHIKAKHQMQGYQRKVSVIGLPSWVSCDGIVNNASLTSNLVCFPFLDRNLYTIRAVPFTDVRSIRRHTPALGWQYIIVVLSSGKQT